MAADYAEGHLGLHWPRDASDICAKIRDHNASLKIVLKTRNDPFFIRRWTDHHRAIVSDQNIIIFDNMSDDVSVLDEYEALRQRHMLIQFSGYHNDIHRVEKFADLYEALRSSAQYYIFLDTDEYLVWISETGGWKADPSLLDALENRQDALAHPGIWLENVPGLDRRFACDPKGNRLREGLRAGKPIISSAARVSGLVGHNFQIDPGMYSSCSLCNFFVLHLKFLSAEQRISSNIQKLRQYKILRPGMSFEDLLSIDYNSLPVGNPRAWLREIHRLRTPSLAPVDSGAPLRRGQLDLLDTGQVSCAGDREAQALYDLINRPAAHIRDVLKSQNRCDP